VVRDQVAQYIDRELGNGMEARPLDYLLELLVERSRDLERHLGVAWLPHEPHPSPVLRLGPWRITLTLLSHPAKLPAGRIRGLAFRYPVTLQ
jgi:hypothetical protein